MRVRLRLGSTRVEAWARGAPASALQPRLAGERIVLKGRVRPLPPGARHFLSSHHVGARLSVDRVERWSAGGPVSRLANGVRRVLVAGAASLPEEQRALFAGFVLGDDRGQSPELVDTFRAAGLTHLLAVSGQNVAFVLALTAPLLKRLRLGGQLCAGLAVLLFFGTLTRWQPSVLRAVAMAALVLVAFARGRPQPGLRVLALAVAGLFLIDLLLVRSIGFLLSVGACVGIIVLGPRLAAVFPGPRPLASVLAVTTAAQIGVAPVVMPAFGGLPVAALPANLLVVPVAGPVMAWGLTGGLVAGFLGDPLARLIHVPTGLLVGWAAEVARWAARLPLGELQARHLVILAALGAVAVVVAAPVASLWRARVGPVAAGAFAGALAGILVMTALTRGPPAPVIGQKVVEGAHLWRAGGATMLVLDDPDPVGLLAGLRRARVGHVDVVVTRRPRASALGPLVRRHPPAHLLAPPGHRLADAMTARTGTRLAVGSLLVEVVSVSSRLEVRIDVARAPPPFLSPALPGG